MWVYIYIKHCYGPQGVMSSQDITCLLMDLKQGMDVKSLMGEEANNGGYSSVHGLINTACCYLHVPYSVFLLVPFQPLFNDSLLYIYIIHW